jgi:hypothetical protein
MAYDPNDPADVAIVTAAVTAERERLTTEHEAAIDRLETENASHRERIRSLRASGGDANTTAEIERLEGELRTNSAELRTAQSQLRQVTRDLETRTTERDTAVSERDRETTAARTAIVNSALTAELAANNVAPHFIEDVSASMSRGVTIREVDGERRPFVGDKPLGDHIKEWALTDKGKHYVVAPGNGGGGSGGPGNPQGGKKLYEMNEAERIELARANPADFQRRMDAKENVRPAS